MRPPIELMKTMRPRASRIDGSSAWVTATCPVRLTSIWRRKSSIGIVSSGLGRLTPALLTRPSSPSPARRRFAPQRRRSGSASVTSSISGVNRSDPASRSDSASSSRRTPAKTRQPAASSRSAVARPMPVDAPVTRADRTPPGYTRNVSPPGYGDEALAVPACRTSAPRNLSRVVAETRKDEAERKQVTVLFADVSGSMDLAEGQDPEEWRKIMQRFFAILASAVERFEGTVDKFTGDGIMAIFGAPIAHEDHARRACYAALQMLDDVSEYAAELRRVHGLNFSTRIGINSGEVVAGAIGAGGRGRVHGDRPHRRPRPADGGAGRARQGLPDRARRGTRERLPRLEGAGRLRDQGRQPARPGLRADRRRLCSLPPRPLPGARVLPLRRPRRGDGPARGGPGASRDRRGRRGRDRRRARCRQEPPQPRVRPSAAGSGASRSSRRRPSPTARRSPSCRCCRCCAPTSASATGSRSGSRARRLPDAPCCWIPISSRNYHSSSTSSASPTPIAPSRR